MDSTDFAERARSITVAPFLATLYESAAPRDVHVNIGWLPRSADALPQPTLGKGLAFRRLIDTVLQELMDGGELGPLLEVDTTDIED